MRDLRALDGYRVDEYNFADCGAFVIPSPVDGGALRVIASSGNGWDHVSVSRTNRCPNWPEMAHVARLFFADGEVAMQLHVPSADHVNCHPHCLHWWRPQAEAIPRPPAWMVGPRPGQTVAEAAAEADAALAKDAR